MKKKIIIILTRIIYRMFILRFGKYWYIDVAFEYEKLIFIKTKKNSFFLYGNLFQNFFFVSNGINKIWWIIDVKTNMSRKSIIWKSKCHLHSLIIQFYLIFLIVFLLMNILIDWSINGIYRYLFFQVNHLCLFHHYFLVVLDRITRSTSDIFHWTCSNRCGWIYSIHYRTFSQRSTGSPTNSWSMV